MLSQYRLSLMKWRFPKDYFFYGDYVTDLNLNVLIMDIFEAKCGHIFHLRLLLCYLLHKTMLFYLLNPIRQSWFFSHLPVSTRSLLFLVRRQSLGYSFYLKVLFKLPLRSTKLTLAPCLRIIK